MLVEVLVEVLEDVLEDVLEEVLEDVLAGVDVFEFDVLVVLEVVLLLVLFDAELTTELIIVPLMSL